MLKFESPTAAPIFGDAVDYRLTQRLRSLRENGAIHVEIAMIQTMEDLEVLVDPLAISVERVFSGRSGPANETIISRWVGEVAHATIYASDRRSACLIIINERDPELAAFLNAAQASPQAYEVN